MDAQEAIEVQVAGGPPSAVTELFLAGCTLPELPGLGTLRPQLVPFLNLRSLSLNGCKLGSLESFPALPNLRLLELADNELTGELTRCGPATSQAATELTCHVLSVARDLTGTLPAPSPHPPYTLPAPSLHPRRQPRAPLRRLAPRTERAQPRWQPDPGARPTAHRTTPTAHRPPPCAP